MGDVGEPMWESGWLSRFSPPRNALRTRAAGENDEDPEFCLNNDISGLQSKVQLGRPLTCFSSRKSACMYSCTTAFFIGRTRFEGMLSTETAFGRAAR